MNKQKKFVVVKLVLKKGCNNLKKNELTKILRSGCRKKPKKIKTAKNIYYYCMHL
jgi:hypothetical protein